MKTGKDIKATQFSVGVGKNSQKFALGFTKYVVCHCAAPQPRLPFSSGRQLTEYFYICVTV